MEATSRGNGLRIGRHWTAENTLIDDVRRMFAWKKVDCVITDASGKETFRRDGVEVPEGWSQSAANILAKLYLRKRGGNLGAEGETSAWAAVARIAVAIARHGRRSGYFTSPDDAEAFGSELAFLMLSQRLAPNSPVWFNVGLSECYGIAGKAAGFRYTPDQGAVLVDDNYMFPQASACFISKVEDDLGCIYDSVKQEVRLFQGGSGTGSNFSAIRGEEELLSGGGRSSGLMSFLKVFDAAAGSTKSGGTCLAPHQRVYTECGPVAVSELAERPAGFVALSYDPPAGRYKAKRARAWIAGSKTVVRVTTDKGRFDLSFDHPMKLSSGEFVEAGKLSAGQSLFACSVDNTPGYLRVHLRDGRKGKEVLHRLVASDVLGLSIDGLSVHHRDGNKHNNDPTNLEVLTQSAHAAEHGAEAASTGNHTFQKRRFPKRGEANGMHKTSRFYSDMARAESYAETQGRVLAQSGRAPEMQHLAAEQKMLNTAFRVLNAGFSIDTFELYVAGRQRAVGRIPSLRKLRSTIIERFGSYSAFVEAVAKNNHRVQSVEPVGEMPVYDVEVDCPTRDDKSTSTGHNFVIWPDGVPIGSGVVVANTRRAAKMVVLDMDHPEIGKFITWKSKEEDKAQALIAAGWPADFNGEAYGTVSGQNSNNSVRVPDAFLSAVKAGAPWETRFRTTGEVATVHDAASLWRSVAESAWRCADPGVHFQDTIERWNTVKNWAPIRASNPCCFTADALVRTRHGAMEIGVLAKLCAAGEPLPEVLCLTEDGQWAYAVPSKAWQSGEASRLVSVRLTAYTPGTQETEGCVVTCTPEHRFMTENGSWVEAQNLRPMHKLMAASRMTRSLPKHAKSFANVVSVTFHGACDVPVFDLEVPGHHNFVVTGKTFGGMMHNAGVVVHNSEFLFPDDTACFAPDTRISTPDGLRTVEQLFAQQVRGRRVMVTTDVAGENDHRQLTAHRPALVTQVGVRPIFRLTLKDGRSIRATADHRFLRDDGAWVAVADLKTTDRLLVREGGDGVSFSSSDEDVRRWQTLGWLSGDGVFSKDTVALTFGPQDAPTAAWMHEEFNRLLQEAHAWAGRTHALRLCEKMYEQPNGVLQITSGNQDLVAYLSETYGFKQATAVFKDVPDRVHLVPRDLQVAYLQGLISADGCVRYSASAREPEVMYASSAPDLIRTVQLLLGDLGIVSRISWHHPSGRKNPQGQLHIYNQQCRNFMSLVGLPISQPKHEKVQEVLGNAFSGALKLPRPVAVVSVEADGESMVYDVTEPVTHTLIAEGMVAHNCNLLSHNLLAYLDEYGKFDAGAFEHACEIGLLAQEILVGQASYPSAAIAENSWKYRPLGQGYANLGALLMVLGLPYDSDAARGWCSAITALMHATCYATSAIMARAMGPFEGFQANREPMLNVIEMHHEAWRNTKHVPTQMLAPCARAMLQMVRMGHEYGFRNAQVSVLAPTGTIGLVMDCDTTGIEPCYSLTSTKALAGGGTMSMVNRSTERALEHLGFGDETRASLMTHLLGTRGLYRSDGSRLLWQHLTDAQWGVADKACQTTSSLSGALLAALGTKEAVDALWKQFVPSFWAKTQRIVFGHGTFEGHPLMNDAELAVFDCAGTNGDGVRFISPDGHLKMMAAAQPFLSGSISKTINCPEETSVEEIMGLYDMAHALGLKCIAIYRNNSKGSQPLTSGVDKSASNASAVFDPVKIIEQAHQQAMAAEPGVGRPARAGTPAEKAQEKADREAEEDVYRVLCDQPSPPRMPARHKLPSIRSSRTYKLTLGDQSVYMIAGCYPDGSLGEVFLTIDQEGGQLGGFVDSLARSISLLLQHGSPLQAIVKLFAHQRFEPAGPVQGHPNVKMCSSIPDLVARVIAADFLGDHTLSQVKPEEAEDAAKPAGEDPLFRTYHETNVALMNLQDHIERDASTQAGMVGMARRSDDIGAAARGQRTARHGGLLSEDPILTRHLAITEDGDPRGPKGTYVKPGTQYWGNERGEWFEVGTNAPAPAAISADFNEMLAYERRRGEREPMVKMSVPSTAPRAASRRAPIRMKAETRACACGGVMKRTGACFTCGSCGANTGCG